jgi:hypothetical protein
MLRRNLQQSAAEAFRARIVDVPKMTQTRPKRRRHADFGSARPRRILKLHAEPTPTMRLRR